MRLSTRAVIMLFLGAASKEEHTQALQLQQSQTVDQQQANRIRGQQRKVARPTSISFDQLSMQNDVITTEIDNKRQPKTANLLQSNTLQKFAPPAEVDKQEASAKTQALNQASNDQKQNAEQSEQVDQTEESKLAEQIRIQAKAIADEQLKQQETDKASGKLKISSAAAALNNAEMGIEAKVDESEKNKNEIVSISSDQLYVSDKKDDSKKKDEPFEAEFHSPDPSTESAAITMAKKAANDAMSPQGGKSATNLEIETSSDLDNSQSIAQLEKNSSDMADAGLSRQNGLVEDKSQTIEEDSDKSDLAMPNWPVYTTPVANKVEINKELVKVKGQAEEFKKSSEEAEQLMKKGYQGTPKSEYEKKQREIELQHKATVSKIKSEIYGDRLVFLQKMNKLIEENETPVPNDKPTVKGQALAQEGTKGMTQDDDKEGKSLKKKQKPTAHKKVDLIHRIDKQLARLRGKNSEKESESETQGETGQATEGGVEDDDADLENKDYSHEADAVLNKIDDSIQHGRQGERYTENDYDEYAVNSNQIHQKVDRYGSMRKDMDLYDIFKDFDRDGDGIVDDIDLDDPNWSENCHKNGWCVEDHDDAFFRAGRYRGLTEEEWAVRETQHQKNLEQLEKKQKELEDAHKEVHEALGSLTTEKDSIDKEIRGKVLETEKMKVEYRKKAAERAAAERKAALERQKAIMQEKQEERKRKALQIRDTEQIEGKAIQLHTKAKELQRQKLLVKDARQEVAEEIRKLKANIKFAQRAKEAATKIKTRINERREWMKKHREEVLKLRKEQREAQLKEQEAERERREKLQESCPHTKVRSYACNADGLRLVKIFRFIYDFDQQRCMPRVERKTVSCKSEVHDMDGDGYDDQTGMPTGQNDYSKWKYSHYGMPESSGIKDHYDHYANHDDYFDSAHDDYSNEYSWRDGYMRADDFHGQKHEKVDGKSMQAQRNSKPENQGGASENLTPEEEQELKGMPEGQDKSESSDSFDKMAGQMDRLEKSDIPERPQRPQNNRGLSKKTPAMQKRAEIASYDETMPESADSFDTKPVQNKRKAPMSLASMKKPLKKQAAPEQTEETSSETTNPTSQDKKIETKSKEQIDQLSQHLGAIENKVQEITQKYEELKKSDTEKDQTIKKLSETRAQTGSSSEVNEKSEEAQKKAQSKGADKSKIQKFAKMLKTLNSYKSQYKKAKTSEEREKIHDQVESFTKKWLDAKNLLLKSEIEFQPPSDTLIAISDVAGDILRQRTELNNDIAVRRD